MHNRVTKQTNYEKITVTHQSLANFIHNKLENANACKICPGFCSENSENCEDYLMDWLQEEAE